MERKKKLDVPHQPVAKRPCNSQTTRAAGAGSGQPFFLPCPCHPATGYPFPSYHTCPYAAYSAANPPPPPLHYPPPRAHHGSAFQSHSFGGTKPAPSASAEPNMTGTIADEPPFVAKKRCTSLIRIARSAAPKSRHMPKYAPDMAHICQRTRCA